MKKIEKAQEISRILNRIYRKVPIPLKHKNKFELVVAVLLSAQCTDERVNQVTPILFKKANTAIKMTKVPKKTIYNIGMEIFLLYPIHLFKNINKLKNQILYNNKDNEI